MIIHANLPAAPEHYAAIADLNRSGFGSDAEGALITRLRDGGLVLIERVVLVAGEVVEHILFSRLRACREIITSGRLFVGGEQPTVALVEKLLDLPPALPQLVDVDHTPRLVSWRRVVPRKFAILLLRSSPQPDSFVSRRALSVEIDGRPVRAAALAPMAVRPDQQRQGIGSRLVQGGLADLRSSDCQAVIVLGDPGFYPRFGFSAAPCSKARRTLQRRAFMAP